MRHFNQCEAPKFEPILSKQADDDDDGDGDHHCDEQGHLFVCLSSPFECKMQSICVFSVSSKAQASLLIQCDLRRPYHGRQKTSFESER